MKSWAGRRPRDPGRATPALVPRHARPATGPAGSTPAAAPPAFRDRWAWAAALAALPLALKSIGAPLGEPVAEDFDFLRRALLSPSNSLLDGGGGFTFWRPITQQLYYETVGRLIGPVPGAVPAIHLALLVAGTLLLYRALRGAWRGPIAAAAAASPLLAESVRTMLAWPCQVVDVGLFFFVALALHETAARRLPSSLGALLAALLCKENAVVLGLMLPWWPPLARRERRAWGLGSLAVLAAWAAAYLAVRGSAGLALPHGLEPGSAALAPLLERVAWAFASSLRAFASLPRVATPRDGLAAALALAPVLALGIVLAARPAARAALRPRAPWIAWGLGWFVLASVALAPIHPLWQPNRHHLGSVGLGIGAAALLESAGPWLVASFVAGRVALLLLGPAPPATITRDPPETGAFMDFERLTRLQRLMRATRTALERRFPELPHGAAIAPHNLPLGAEYAFGGAKALQVWYADTTLRWTGFEEPAGDGAGSPLALVEFEPTHAPQVALVEPAALHALSRAVSLSRERRYAEALVAAARAESLQRDPDARVLLGTAMGVRATALLGLDREDEARDAARRALALFPWSLDARFSLGMLALRDGELAAAEAAFDSILAIRPDEPFAAALRESVRAARRR